MAWQRGWKEEEDRGGVSVAAGTRCVGGGPKGEMADRAGWIERGEHMKDRKSEKKKRRRDETERREAERGRRGEKFIEKRRENKRELRGRRRTARRSGKGVAR